MGSIRVFLIAGILATLTLFNFVAALRGYQSSMVEAETLFDNQLLDLSQLVANLDLDHIKDDFRVGNNLAFQIWENASLSAATVHAPQTPISNFVPGFDFANFDGYRWRTFTRYEEGYQRWVIVAERTDLRFVLAENVVLESIMPILLGIPLIGLLIWLIVSHGLKPLNQLSDELRNKQMNDLAPISFANTRKELTQVVQSVNGFIYRLSQGFEREKRFSADAAHELRTPISALKVQLHNLKEELGSEPDTFVQLEEGVDRMQHLVEQLLSLYRATPEQFFKHCEKLDLYELTQNVVAQLYPVIEKKNQTLELEGSKCLIQGESFALETLLTNLINNASKYTPEGGMIKITVEHRNKQVHLQVEDNGPGIAESEKEKIFDRFYRVNQPDRDVSVEGCGLGLTIVKHVAELHHAEVALTNSDFETGSAFTVSFPAESEQS